MSKCSIPTAEQSSSRFHDTVDRYTLKGALRDAEIDMDEFLANVK